MLAFLAIVAMEQAALRGRFSAVSHAIGQHLVALAMEQRKKKHSPATILPPAARMRSRVYVREIAHVEMCVALGRIDAAMAKQLLHMTQIRSSAKQVRCERVSQRVCRDASRDRSFSRRVLHSGAERFSAETTP